MNEPLNNGITNSNQTGARSGFEINDVKQSAPSGYNSFNHSYQFFHTPKFGNITPHFVDELVGNSSIILKDNFEARAYTFTAPVMSPMRMLKSFYAVPRKCLMPRAFSRFTTVPKHGDDVPDNVNLMFEIDNFIDILKRKLQPIKPYDPSFTYDHAINAFRLFLLGNSIFSYGSLAASLCEPLSSAIICSLPADNSAGYIDVTFDELYSHLFGNLLNFLQSEKAAGREVVFPQLLENQSNGTLLLHKKFTNYDAYTPTMIMEYFDIILQSDPDLVTSDKPKLLAIINAFFGKSWNGTFFRVSCESPQHKPTFVNISRLVAYQLVCAQYFTNDSVDDIIDSQYWLDNMDSIIFTIMDKYPIYVYNGQSIQYDTCSQAVTNSVLVKMRILPLNDINYHLALDYFANIFCLQKSLRFVDYFTGARLEPLAGGDDPQNGNGTNAPVVGGNVSAIDVTKAISMQRFLHAVNRVGSQVYEYLKGIFGYQPSNLPPMPKFIATDIYPIQHNQVACTSDGENLGNLVSNLEFTQSKYAFNAYLDEDSIVIGVTYFEYVPAYKDCVDKLCFARDRYDYFQPFLQTIGDQDIDGREITLAAPRVPFAYTTRDMEYKQRTSRAVGGFVVNSLPGYALMRQPSQIGFDKNIVPLNSYNIRHTNTEFDGLFSSLTATNTAQYFHIILSENNECVVNAPMLRKPQIL